MSVITEIQTQNTQLSKKTVHDSRSPARSPTSAGPPSKKVKWEVEDPSEFRPGALDNMGKDKENFRGFSNVEQEVKIEDRVESS